MITPPRPFSIIFTAASRAHRNTPLRSTAITLWKSISDIFLLPSAAFTNRASLVMPALLMRPSTLPKSLRTLLNSASTAGSSVTSAGL